MLDIRNNLVHRKMYQTAKQQFVHRAKISQDYWDQFSKAHNLEVIIDHWNGQYPVVEALEFNTEADYAWFLLRYS